MKRTKDDGKEDSAADPVGHSSSNGTDATAPVTPSSSGVSAAATAAASVRTTGRVKKPRQVYDPSDNYVSRASNRSSVGGAGGSTPSAAVASTTQSPLANVSATMEASDSLDSNPSPSLMEKLQNRNFDTCQKCSKSEPKRGSGHKSNFLTCKSCMQKWHFPCLAVNFENLSLARKKYKCEKCRYCSVCNVRGRDLPICSICAEAYHPHCNNTTLKPGLKSTEINPIWKCFRCEGSNTTSNNTSSSSGEQPSPLVRKSHVGRRKRAKVEKLEKLENLDLPLKSKKEKNKEEKVVEKADEQCKQDSNKEKKTNVEDPLETQEPIKITEHPKNSIASRLTTPPPQPAVEADVAVDMQRQPVSSWSVEQVVGFVGKHYPKEANVFRYQDIDGASLLLLTRKDVMNRFGLKLGPALRVFELVLSLQSQSDDVTLAWLE